MSRPYYDDQTPDTSGIMDSAMPLIVLVAVVAVGAFWFIRRAERDSQSNARARFAAELGWAYTERADGLAERYEGTPFDRGRRKIARDAMRGTYRDRRMTSFEYHYRTHGPGSGAHGTQHVYLVVVLTTPGTGPTLEVTSESIETRLGKLVGERDVRMDVREFDKRFFVSCDDEDFARSVLNKDTIGWLLGEEGKLRYPFRFEGSELVVWSPGWFGQKELLEMLDFGCDLIAHVPDSAWRR